MAALFICRAKSHDNVKGPAPFPEIGGLHASRDDWLAFSDTSQPGELQTVAMSNQLGLEDTVARLGLIPDRQARGKR
jgi:hypothetical protein